MIILSIVSYNSVFCNPSQKNITKLWVKINGLIQSIHRVNFFFFLMNWGEIVYRDIEGNGWLSIQLSRRVLGMAPGKNGTIEEILSSVLSH